MKREAYDQFCMANAELLAELEDHGVRLRWLGSRRAGPAGLTVGPHTYMLEQARELSVLLLGLELGERLGPALLSLGGLEDPEPRACRKCGCVDARACVTAGVPCHWVEWDLCSACAPAPGPAQLRLVPSEPSSS